MTPEPADAEVLTVQEAANLLRISRNAAYALARQWITTHGERGLPCIELGRTLRVPRAALQQMLDDANRPARSNAGAEVA